LHVHHHTIEIISPFGFELMQDQRFLSGNLRRFYCYIGIPEASGESPQRYAREFDQVLSAYLALHHPDFHSRIVIKAIQDQFLLLKPSGYQCQHDDILIDIQTRVIDSTLLDDYANYIICSLSSILE